MATAARKAIPAKSFVPSDVLKDAVAAFKSLWTRHEAQTNMINGATATGDAFATELTELTQKVKDLK